MDSFSARVAEAAKLVGKSRWAVAFTGAGISTESGLSDFRSPGGVWERYRVVTYQEFVASHNARVEYWSQKRDFYNELRQGRPNKAHLALAELERAGKLKGIISQNIDGFHQMAGSSAEGVVELHGTNRTAYCLKCARVWPIEEIHRRLEVGDLDPECEDCGGYIKPSTVSFGQAMPEAAMAKAFEWATQADLLLMIGSSLQVHPAASIPPLAHSSGAKLIFINRTETPCDYLAAVLFRESAGDVMEALLQSLKMDNCGKS
jgi:NAD-dependent deacetylase